MILRFRLLRTDYWLRKGLVYSLLTVFIISAYGLLVSGLSLLLSTRVSSNNPFLIGGLVFLIAVFLDPCADLAAGTDRQHFLPRPARL